MNSSKDDAPFSAADLYCDARAAEWRQLLPGMTVVVAGTLAAGFLSDHYGTPLTLMALLVGLALNFLSTDERLAPGLAMASQSLLRWGIVLVGLRVTSGQVLALGPTALLALLVIVGAVIAASILVSRRLGLGTAFGTLAGGSVAICGASAAMALATVLGERRTSRAQLTLVLVGVSAMSATAMVLYPLLASALKMSDIQAGFLLGGAIHDVAQSLGAGYSYSVDAGEIAAIVKLTRVSLLAPLLAVVAFFLPRIARGARIRVPWFVIGFFVCAGVNSLGVVPAIMATGAEKLAGGLLAAAVTATGIQSPLRQLMRGGLHPLVVILAATIISLLLTVLAVIFVVG